MGLLLAKLGATLPVKIISNIIEFLKISHCSVMRPGFVMGIYHHVLYMSRLQILYLTYVRGLLINILSC